MNTDRRSFLALTGSATAAFTLFGCKGATAQPPEHFQITKTEAQWRKQLSPAAFDILRKDGTERPYSSPLNDEHRAGIFSCKGCALPNYSSTTKFDSHTGWPSFWKPLENAVAERKDGSLGFTRTEIHCRRCGGASRPCVQ